MQELHAPSGTRAAADEPGVSIALL
jgi:hypothetical protein